MTSLDFIDIENFESLLFTKRNTCDRINLLDKLEVVERFTIKISVFIRMLRMVSCMSISVSLYFLCLLLLLNYPKGKT